VPYYWRKTKTGSYFVKQEQDAVSTEDIENRIKELVENYKFPILPYQWKTDFDNDLTIYPLVDIHHGQLSWGEETGEDWDIKKSMAFYEEQYGKLIVKSKPTKHAWIVNLGDFFHANDGTNATPKSKHTLDVDSRFYKMLDTGVLLMKRIVDLVLQKHDKVTIVNIRGNHDPDSYATLPIALYWAFHGDPRVEVEKSPSEFWVKPFGNFLYAANHGYRVNEQQFANKINSDYRELVGKAKYIRAQKGHLHHAIAKEIGGVYVETLQTGTPKDANAANGGYTSGRSIKSLYVTETGGVEGEAFLNF
jgi:hypothetical protein